MDTRMMKGFDFVHEKGMVRTSENIAERMNIGIFCVQTKEYFKFNWRVNNE